MATDLLTNLPRKPLYPWEKRRLEKEFSHEVPEFSQFITKKRKSENAIYGSAIAAGLFTGITSLKWSGGNVIGSVVLGGFTTVALLAPFRYAVFRYFYGLHEYDRSECQRAFNLWVYYRRNPERQEEIQWVNKAAERYQENLNKFKAAYDPARYE